MKRINLIAAMLLVVAAGMQAQKSHDPSRYYLELGDVADSEALLPAMPDTLSARFAYDREQYEWGKMLRGTERGRQAVVDADLSDGWIDRSFSEAFGMPITRENLPEIYALVSTMKDDAGDLSTRKAKEHYMRVRPFVFFKEASATPWDEEMLAANGSYPSGHTAIGWATALVLAEINPARVNEILQRGYEFGQSRVIVGAHYQSDVDMGRVTGAGAVAVLHANPEFRARLAAAKAEFAAKSRK